MLIEYKVRPVTRYCVTRFVKLEDRDAGLVPGLAPGSSVMGEYDNENVAHEVGYALCKAENARLGWKETDERIQYPKRAGNSWQDYVWKVGCRRNEDGDPVVEINGIGIIGTVSAIEDFIARYREDNPRR